MKSKWLAASAGHFCMLCTFSPLPVCRRLVSASVRPYVSLSVHLYFWLSPVRPKMYSCVSTGPSHFSNLLMYTCCRSQEDFQLFTWWPTHTHTQTSLTLLHQRRMLNHFQHQNNLYTVGSVSNLTRVGDPELRNQLFVGFFWSPNICIASFWLSNELAN